MSKLKILWIALAIVLLLVVICAVIPTPETTTAIVQEPPILDARGVVSIAPYIYRYVDCTVGAVCWWQDTERQNLNSMKELVVCLPVNDYGGLQKKLWENVCGE